MLVFNIEDYGSLLVYFIKRNRKSYPSQLLAMAFDYAHMKPHSAISIALLSETYKICDNSYECLLVECTSFYSLDMSGG